MIAPFTIAGRPIGPGGRCYIIAELSANHNGRFEDAVRLVRAAKECGADAVKIQTYTADTLTIRCDRPEFQIGGGTLWDGKTLHDLYSEAYTPWDWQPKLKAVADDLELHLFSTPFDPTAVDFLEDMGVPAHKIASFEIVDIPLVTRIARTGKPILMSTGMATLAEISEAVEAVRSTGNHQLALLKCTSGYPSPEKEMYLRTIPHMADAFALPVGLSDHTLGSGVPVAAVVLGACVIEKHFALSREVPGPDSAFSMEPHEFKEMVDAVRTAEKAIGSVHYGLTAAETKSRVFRRSLYVISDVAAGELLTQQNVRSIRPAFGLAPKHLPAVLGRHARCPISRGTPLSWDLIAE